jgi:hypothetical protein
MHMKSTLFGVIVLSGCAMVSAGSEPRVVRVDVETQVCVDHVSLRAGQALSLHRRVCRERSPKNTTFVCADELVANAVVVRVIDDRCAVIRLPRDVEVQERDRIELATQ